jgi:hypothetical protein
MRGRRDYGRKVGRARKLDNERRLQWYEGAKRIEYPSIEVFAQFYDKLSRESGCEHVRFPKPPFVV